MGNGLRGFRFLHSKRLIAKFYEKKMVHAERLVELHIKYNDRVIQAVEAEVSHHAMQLQVGIGLETTFACSQEEFDEDEGENDAFTRLLDSGLLSLQKVDLLLSKMIFIHPEVCCLACCLVSACSSFTFPRPSTSCSSGARFSKSFSNKALTQPA